MLMQTKKFYVKGEFGHYSDGNVYFVGRGEHKAHLRVSALDFYGIS